MPGLRLTKGDVLSGLPNVPDDSVNLVFVSPPYFEEFGFSDALMVALGRLIARVLRPGWRAYVVFGQVSESFDRQFQVQSQILFGGAPNDLRAAQSFIWAKSLAVEGVTHGHYTPLNSDRLCYFGHEHVYGFTKGDPRKARPLDRLAVGVPYSDVRNLDRGTRGKHGNVHDRGDVIFCPYETTGKTQKKGHAHAFPAALARHFIKLVNVPSGGVIFDPCCGGGTTLAVARELGLDAWGNDVDPSAVESSRAAWDRADVVARSKEEMRGEA